MSQFVCRFDCIYFIAVACSVFHEAAPLFIRQHIRIVSYINYDSIRHIIRILRFIYIFYFILFLCSRNNIITRWGEEDVDVHRFPLWLCVTLLFEQKKNMIEYVSYKIWQWLLLLLWVSLQQGHFHFFSLSFRVAS